MDDYKASPAFEEEVIEAYQFGFGNYKEVVLVHFPNLDLASI